MPHKAVNKTFVETLEYIARQSRLVLEKEEAENHIDQMVINPETGEIEED